MKVVHVVNVDIIGGASKAAFALNKALLEIGVDSKMLVQRKFSNIDGILSVSDTFSNKQKTNVRMLFDLIQMKIFTKTKKGRFSFGNVGIDITNHGLIQEADIVHLHWINEGYLSIKSLSKLSKLNKPIVWTLHDMWAFTGGCHYSSGCLRYLSSCGNCPYLILPSDSDFSNTIFLAKKKLYKKFQLAFITCSEWLANIAREVPQFKDKMVSPIHNTLDTNVYKPIDQIYIRGKLNLPKDKFLILFVALSTKEERKGFSYLKNSLDYLVKQYPMSKDQIELLILGSSSIDQLKGIPLKVNTSERKREDKDIAEYYNAANIFLAPSQEDNLPNTVLESLSCGTPVVAFKIGGIPEMVEHKKNGYLAEAKSLEDFSNGIYWMFQNRDQLKDLRKNARNKIVEYFSPQLIANAHLSFYKKQLNNRISKI